MSPSQNHEDALEANIVKPGLLGHSHQPGAFQRERAFHCFQVKLLCLLLAGTWRSVSTSRDIS